MAAINTYDYNLCLEICEKVSLGGNIKSILESDKKKYPSFPTFCRWKRENTALFNLYINSHQDKAVALEQELDLYKEMLLKGEIDASTYNVLVQTLKWKMAKFYPKVFGEKSFNINENTNTNKPIDLSKLSIEELETLEKINKKVEDSND